MAVVALVFVEVAVAAVVVAVVAGQAVSIYKNTNSRIINKIHLLFWL